LYLGTLNAHRGALGWEIVWTLAGDNDANDRAVEAADELRAEVDAMDETAVETVDVRVARGATREMVEDMARRRWGVGGGGRRRRRRSQVGDSGCLACGKRKKVTARTPPLPLFSTTPPRSSSQETQR
jgi:hypothetical protein